jgi:hypothetical protein
MECMSTLNGAWLRNILAALDGRLNGIVRDAADLKKEPRARVEQAVLPLLAALCLAPAASHAEQISALSRAEDYIAAYVSLLDASGKAVGAEVRMTGNQLAPVLGLSYMNNSTAAFTVASASVRASLVTAVGEIPIPCPDDSTLGASMSCALPAFAPVTVTPGAALIATYDRTTGTYPQAPKVSFTPSVVGAQSPPLASLIDATGNVWTTQNGKVFKNGVDTNCVYTDVTYIWVAASGAIRAWSPVHGYMTWNGTTWA